MAVDKYLAKLFGAIGAVDRLFQESQHRGIIIGAVATSVLGDPRFTEDVDGMILASNEDLTRLLEKASHLGLEPRIKNIAEFAIQRRILLLIHKPTGINVDLSLGALPFEMESVKRSQKVTVAGVTFPIPTPEDLIIFKAVASRPKDLGDIEGVLQAHPDLDLKRIRKKVKEFSDLLEMPEIMTALEKLLEKAAKRTMNGRKNSKKIIKLGSKLRRK